MVFRFTLKFKERFAPVLSPEKTKKACIHLYFRNIILFKGKAISYHLIGAQWGQSMGSDLHISIEKLRVMDKM